MTAALDELSSPSPCDSVASSTPARVPFRWLAGDPEVTAPMLRSGAGREIRADLGFEAVPHVFPTAR